MEIDLEKLIYDIWQTEESVEKDDEIWDTDRILAELSHIRTRLEKIVDSHKEEQL